MTRIWAIWSSIVTKVNFLDWIQKARIKAINANIESGSRATGLVPFNPNQVLAKLPDAPTMESLGQPPDRASPKKKKKTLPQQQHKKDYFSTPLNTFQTYSKSLPTRQFTI